MSTVFDEIAGDKKHKRLKAVLWLVAVVAFLSVAAAEKPSPEEVFRNPPPEAHAGVWWHWMGSQVTREGIAKDLDWFSRMGITSATIFGMCDSCTPWAKRIANVPTNGLRPYDDEWWKLVKFACAEGKKRNIDIGLHNCPGYTSTGGKWIPSRLAMRRLVFGGTNVVARISLASEAPWPVFNEDKGRVENPACPERHTDYQKIGEVDGLEIGHIPMGSYIQPADWDSFGLECDKMNPEAVDFHLDHVIADFKRHLGSDLPAAGLRHVLLDSYEAGLPSWTPDMRAEFQKRRGYDCLKYLPILGGIKTQFTPQECQKFRVDFERTLRDLYRDVLFKRMSERLHAEGLAFSCEPYAGPFVPEEVAPFIDRLMTEFWYNPKKPGNLFDGFHGRFNQYRRPDGKRHNIVEAEAFTGKPKDCAWCETPASLKPGGDRAWLLGVNRFILHTCPLQPWGDDMKPGVTMGRWGVHFGRNQTWAESGKAWFDYVARSQALLQWGEPYPARLKINGCGCISRHVVGDGKRTTTSETTVYFLVSEVDETIPLDLKGEGRWFDPVTGEIGAPPAVLLPRQSGFWVTGGGEPPKSAAEVPRGEIVGWMPALGDWTQSTDSGIRYFSGTRTYRATFDAEKGEASAIDLGKVLGATAAVRVNGVDCGTVWCAPWRVKLPAGVLKAKGNRIEIDLTNVWANRLIGDEQEPSDLDFAAAPAGPGQMLVAYPDWFAQGLASRPSKNRRCFTTWNHFTRTSPLIPSGLVGPVILLGRCDRLADR